MRGLLRYGQYGTSHNHGVPPYRGQCFISSPMFSCPRTPHVSWTWTQFGAPNLLPPKAQIIWSTQCRRYLGEIIFSGTHFCLSKYWTSCILFSFEQFFNLHLLRRDVLRKYRNNWVTDTPLVSLSKISLFRPKFISPILDLPAYLVRCHVILPNSCTSYRIKPHMAT